MVIKIRLCFLDLFISSLDNDILDIFQFGNIAYQRDHDFRNDMPLRMFLVDFDGSTDDRFGLHLGDFRISDSQTAASVTHHRVDFMQGIADSLQFFQGHAHFFCQDFLFFFTLRYEFM